MTTALLPETTTVAIEELAQLLDAGEPWPAETCDRLGQLWPAVLRDLFHALKLRTVLRRPFAEAVNFDPATESDLNKHLRERFCRNRSRPQKTVSRPTMLLKWQFHHVVQNASEKTRRMLWHVYQVQVQPSILRQRMRRLLGLTYLPGRRLSSFAPGERYIPLGFPRVLTLAVRPHRLRSGKIIDALDLKLHALHLDVESGVRDKHLSFCAKRGIRSWQEINKTNTKQYGNWLHGQDYADRSIYLELTLIKSVLGRLIDEGTLPEACRFKLPLSKPIGTDTYCYMPDEVNAIVRFCRSRPALHWLAAVIVGLACTGMRIGELASLRWSDVDFDSRTILLTDERASSRRRKLGQVRTTKGKRNRSVPICKELLRVLKALKSTKHADSRIFHGPRGGILKPDTVRNIFLRDVIEPLKATFPTPLGEIGFEHGRLHSFRHYFCSQAFRDGVSEAEIMAWLGWRDSKMVAHYRHLRREDGQRKIDEIDFLGRATARGGRATKVV